ncbi:MAG: hypothetical protein K6W08_15925, partial [Firmicutes bacterium]|nr:hypothetical protein [Bacillota bacterium]
MRYNSVVAGVVLVGLFVTSLVIGYLVGERYFKSTPGPSQGQLAPPPTAPPTPAPRRLAQPTPAVPAGPPAVPPAGGAPRAPVAVPK